MLQSDGDNYSVFVNAATLTLVNAGIEMKEFVVSYTASIVNDTLLIDISLLEETTGKPDLTAAVFPISRKVTYSYYNEKIYY